MTETIKPQAIFSFVIFLFGDCVYRHCINARVTLWLLKLLTTARSCGSIAVVILAAF